ncbi:ferric reductase like transmembrane component [Poronia punctata]|nr:ferric reductase like transmembrane component [Poronia punctata]
MSRFFLFLSFFSSLLVNASGSEKGIIGFGRTIYPDLCCLTCHTAFASLYLSCTTFTSHHHGDMEMQMGMTSDECRTSNTPYLQSMAYCIQQECSAEGYSHEEQAKCFHTHVSVDTTTSFHDSLPETPPSIELEEDAEWLNVTKLVNRHVYHVTYGTMAEFASMEYSHTKYSMILYLLVIGTCLLFGIKSQISSTSPFLQRHLSKSPLVSKIRQHITLPALLGSRSRSRHLEPLPGNMGYVPSRALSISITIIIVLNIIFSSVSFGSFQPNIFWPSQAVELCEYVGNRTGTLSLVNMSIAILFAGRNNILIAVTGWSQTTFLTLHRWTARVATVQAVVHSVVYTIMYFEKPFEGARSYAEKAAEPFYWWGIIGTIALCLATAFAILPLRVRSYEFFLVVHIILIVLALVACWYHLIPHFGFQYGYQVWLYICFAFWAADRLARLVRITYYNRLGDAKATIEAIPGSNILHVKVFPRVARGVGPGQHTFLYFPGLGKFWESHPFSIAAWEVNNPEEKKKQSSSSISTMMMGKEEKEEKEEEESSTKPTEITYATRQRHYETKTPTTTTEAHKYNGVCFHLLVRAHSGMTGDLHRYLSSSPSRAEVSVYTEGYYAGHRATLESLYTADTVLCLVGGSGISHALGFVQEYRRRGEMMGNVRRFVLAWSAREIAFIDYVRRNFLAETQDIEVSFWCTGDLESRPPWTAGRMDIASVVRSSVEVGHQTTVLVCGPGQMADETRKQVVGCVKDGFRVHLVEEAFAW